MAPTHQPQILQYLRIESCTSSISSKSGLRLKRWRLQVRLDASLQSTRWVLLVFQTVCVAIPVYAQCAGLALSTRLFRSGVCMTGRSSSETSSRPHVRRVGAGAWRLICLLALGRRLFLPNQAEAPVFSLASAPPTAIEVSTERLLEGFRLGHSPTQCAKTLTPRFLSTLRTTYGLPFGEEVTLEYKMAKKRHGRLTSSSSALHAESDDHSNRSTKRRKLQKALPRESQASKAAIVDHLHRVRLQRAVERGRRELRRYVAPKPPERSMRWRLRGAARPWEEVEAAKVADHHAPTVDVIALHGHALCGRLGDSARKWRDSLVDLGRLRLGCGELEAGMSLLGEALSIDAADERGASLVALNELLGAGVEGEWCVRYLTSSRGLPRWTLFFSSWLRASELRAKLLEEAIQANPFAPWCLAFPEAADAAIEYAGEIGCQFAPAGILEALHIHLHARSFFESRPAQRASVAKYIQQHVQFGENVPPAPDEPHENAQMFVNMFATLRDMVSENLEKQPVSHSSV